MEIYSIMMRKSNINKSSVFGEVQQKWLNNHSIKHYTELESLCDDYRYTNPLINFKNFITIINRIENTEYKISDFIYEKYIKDAEFIYIIIDHEVLLVYKCPNNNFSDSKDCTEDVFIDYTKINDIYMKIKTIIIKNDIMIDGYDKCVKEIKNKSLIHDIGNNISKDVLNYIVMEYLEEENLLAELDSDLYKELNF